MKKSLFGIISLILLNATICFADAPPKIEDLEVINQNGKKVHFYSDLVKGKKIAVNFIYTSCKMICSPMSASLSGLNNILKDRKEKDYQLISITLDPVSDTPAALKKFAEKHGQTEGWTLVTGESETIKKLLKSLGGWAPNTESHAPLTLMGDDKNGDWKKVYGIRSPKALEKEFTNLSAK